MIRLPALLLALLAMIAGAAPCAAQTDPRTGRPLGPQRRFEGVYVTNFEIGYVYECEAALGACDDWQKIESRWLVGGTPDVERQLKDCAARWNGSRDRWALYAIAFMGRETLDRRPKSFLHGTERYVLVDRIAAFEMIGTDETIDWALPRYRRRPVMAC
jgi:hypothetical protein